MESEGFVCSEVRTVAVNNLAELYTLCKHTHTHTPMNLYCILSTHHHKNRCFACGLIGPALTHTHAHALIYLPTYSSVLIRPFKRLVCVNM